MADLSNVTSENMQARPLRILHIFGQMQRGGAELRTLDVMRHLDRTRYKLHFCVLSGLTGVLDDDIRDLGGEVHLCALGAGFAGRFSRLLRKEQFDAVHSHVSYTSGYILRLAHKARVPVRIAHFRSTGDGQPNTLRRLAQRALMRYWINRHATHILGVSQGALEAGWPRCRNDHRCAVIYNGLDLEPYAALPDRASVRHEFGFPLSCRLYIHVGRVDPSKNHKRLLEIFALLSERDSTARLVMVGRADSHLALEIRAQAEALHLSDVLIFAGERRDVPRLLKAADLMLYPSQREGLPGAVLEACAAGTPVLGSDLPGIKEIAERLPQVRYLSLNEPNEIWTELAHSWSEVHKPSKSQTQDAARSAAASLFAQSDFSIQRCVDAHNAVWEGCIP